MRSAFTQLRPDSLSERFDAALADRSQGRATRRRGLFGALMAVIWLGLLIRPIRDSWSAGQHVQAIIGTVALIAFGALVTLAFYRFGRLLPTDPVDGHRAQVWCVICALIVLDAVLLVLYGGSALPVGLYIAIIGILYLSARESALIVVAVTAALLLLPVAFPRSDFGSVGLYLFFIPGVIWIGRQMGLRGDQLAELNRRQRAELDIIAERNRVARDVHDILGHSLTVITVKTELAQRLVDVDLARAKTEMADIERLAREALAGVRDTVGGLREISLRGEILNARTALAAADIDARLPDPDRLPEVANGELFGWVLREAVTNVIRHSAARHCAVSVTASTIEVLDDGRGLGELTKNSDGSGLSGLRERLRTAGGTLSLSGAADGGLRVYATVPNKSEGKS